jgi:dienelactone hydrolase
VRRPAAGTGAIAAVGLGLVLTAAAGAIVVRYVGAGQVGARAVGGLVAALAGLALLVSGTTRLLAPVRPWRRLLAIPVALGLVHAVAVPVVVAVVATNVPRSELGPDTPATDGLAYVDASFPTADGVELSGWYVPSRNGAAVALLHGASSNRTAVLDHALVLAAAGFGVLLFDARGQGRSGGRAMNLGWYGDVDVDAAVDYLVSRPDVDLDRIAVLGESMGGEQAIGALAADDRIRAVVAEGATSRVAADQDWLSERYGGRGWLQEGINRFTFGLTDLLTSASPPPSLRAAATTAAPRPILLIAGGAVADEVDAADHIRRASPDSVDVWVVPGGRHTGGLRERPEEWQSRVTAFLDEALEVR